MIFSQCPIARKPGTWKERGKLCTKQASKQASPAVTNALGNNSANGRRRIPTCGVGILFRAKDDLTGQLTPTDTHISAYSTGGVVVLHHWRRVAFSVLCYLISHSILKFPQLKFLTWKTECAYRTAQKHHLYRHFDCCRHHSRHPHHHPNHHYSFNHNIVIFII